MAYIILTYIIYVIHHIVTYHMCRHCSPVMHLHVYTWICMSIQYMHMCLHVCMYAYIYKHRCTYTPIACHINLHIHIYIHTYMCTPTQKNVFFFLALTHTNTCTHTHSHARAHTSSHIHTCKRTKQTEIVDFFAQHLGIPELQPIFPIFAQPRTCTHVSESCRTYEWVMSHIWIDHGTSRFSPSHEPAHAWVSHVAKMDASLVAHMNSSCQTYECVMAVQRAHAIFALSMRHTLQHTATHCNALRYIWMHVIYIYTHVSARVLSRIWIRICNKCTRIHMNKCNAYIHMYIHESCHAYKYTISSHSQQTGATPWLIRICDMTLSKTMARLCDMTQAYMCVTWLIHVRDTTRSYVWYDPFICVAWPTAEAQATNLLEEQMQHTHTHPHSRTRAAELPQHTFSRVMWIKEHASTRSEKSHVLPNKGVMSHIRMRKHYIYIYIYICIYIYMHASVMWIKQHTRTRSEGAVLCDRAPHTLSYSPDQLPQHTYSRVM